MGFWNRLFGKKAAATTSRSHSSSGVTPLQKSATVTSGSAAGSQRKPPSSASLVIEELQASTDPRKKCELIKDLGKHRGDEVVEALLRCLKDPDEKVRVYAVGTLPVVGDPRAVEPLLEVLMTDTAHDPCYYATKALARFKTPRAIAGMVSALESQKGDLSELAFQLGEVRAREGVDALCKLAEGSGGGSDYARRHAVMSLANIGDRRAIPALKKALGDTDEGVRERAQKALQQLS
jgi:HEAT repeat protein